MIPSGRATPAAAIAGLAALVVAPVAAAGALTYDFSLGARVMRTDNLYFDPEPTADGQREPVEETVYALVPALKLEWRDRKDRLYLDTRGEYWTFSGDEDLDPVWLPDLTADLEWRRWAPFFLEAGAERERVPSNQDREGESILDQADRTFLSLRTGLSWVRGTNPTVEVGYHGEFEDFSGGKVVRDDRVVSHFAEGLLRHQWTPLLTGEASVRYGRVEQELADDYTEMGAVASVDYRLSERLTARGRLEWVREEVEVTGDPDAHEEGPSTRTSLLGYAEVRGAFERQGFWSLRYDDRQEAQPDGDTLGLRRAAAQGLLRARLGSEIGVQLWHEWREFRVSGRDETDWGPTVLARWVIAPWLALDTGGSWADTTIREPGEEEVEDRTTRVAAAFLAQAGRHFTAEAGYSYRDNDSTDGERSYTANLLYAGVTYHFREIPPGKLPPSEVGRLATPDDEPVPGR